MHKGYRILSVEVADIYKAEQENGVAVRYQLPDKNSGACFRLFKVFLEASLDSAAPEKIYKHGCRKGGRIFIECIDKADFLIYNLIHN